MRRVFGWSIPLVLIAIGLLWPLVFRGGRRAAPRRRPGGLQQLPGRLRRQRRRQARRRRNHHRRVPRRAPRHLPVLGRRQPEQPIRAAGTRHHVGEARRRTRAVPDAVDWTASGSGWPRSVIPTSTSVSAPMSSRSATPFPVSSTREAPAPTRDSPNPPATTRAAPSVFFWNVIARSWNNRIQQADISRDPAGRRHRRAVFGRLRGRRTRAAT